MTRALTRPLRLLLPWGGRPDPRSPAQIDDEIAEELSFHLDRLTDEYASDGCAPAEARRLAEVRFGNIEDIASRCRTVALEDQIMLQRLNMALMVVVILLIVGMGAQMFLNQRASARAMDELADRLMMISEQSRSDQGGTGARTAGLVVPGVVYLTGDVERPGTYNLPQTAAMTVRRLIAASGMHISSPGPAVVIEGLDTDGQRIVRFSSPDIFAEGESDPLLRSNDLVRVTAANRSGDEAEEIRRQNAAIGDFVRQVYVAAGSHRTNDPVPIRQIIDEAARRAEQDYADDPVTLGVIRELVAARRRLFDLVEANAPADNDPDSQDESLSLDMRAMLRLRELTHAVIVAAASGDGRLPESLETLVAEGAIKEAELQSPAGRVPDGGAAYVYAAAGLDPESVNDWSRRVVLIDRTLLLRGGNVAAAFLDGHVEMLSAADFDALLNESVNVDVRTKVSPHEP